MISKFVPTKDIKQAIKGIIEDEGISSFLDLFEDDVATYKEASAQIDLDRAGSKRIATYICHAPKYHVLKYCVSDPSVEKRANILTILTDKENGDHIIFDGTGLSHFRTAVVAVNQLRRYAPLDSKILILGRGPIGTYVNWILKEIGYSEPTMVGRNFDNFFENYNAMVVAVTEDTPEPLWHIQDFFKGKSKAVVIDLTRHAFTLEGPMSMVIANEKQLEWDTKVIEYMEDTETKPYLMNHFLTTKDNIYVRLPGSITWDVKVLEAIFTRCKGNFLGLETGDPDVL